MNFWKGLLKQIAKCSLLTDEKEGERGGRRETEETREREEARSES